jgi:hypothetical protein
VCCQMWISSSSASPADSLAATLDPQTYARLKNPPRVNASDFRQQRNQWSAATTPTTTTSSSSTSMSSTTTTTTTNNLPAATPTIVSPSPVGSGSKPPTISASLFGGAPRSTDPKLRLDNLGQHFAQNMGQLSQNFKVDTASLRQTLQSQFQHGGLPGTGTGGGGGGGEQQQKALEYMKTWLQHQTATMSSKISDFTAFSGFAVRTLRDACWSRDHDHENWATHEAAIYAHLSASAARMLQKEMRQRAMKALAVTEIWASHAPVASLQEHAIFSKQFDRLLMASFSSSPANAEKTNEPKLGVASHIFPPHLIIHQLLVEESIPRIFALATIGDVDQCPQQAAFLQFSSPTTLTPTFKDRCLLIHDLADYQSLEITFRTLACKMVKITSVNPKKCVLGIAYTKENVQQHDPKSECFYRLFDVQLDQFVSSSPTSISGDCKSKMQVLQDLLHQPEHDLVYALLWGENCVWNLVLLRASTGQTLTTFCSSNITHQVPLDHTFLPIRVCPSLTRPAQKKKMSSPIPAMSTVTLLGAITSDDATQFPDEISCWYNPSDDAKMQKKIQCYRTPSSQKKLNSNDRALMADNHRLYGTPITIADIPDKGTVRYHRFFIAGNHFEMTFHMDLKTTYVYVQRKDQSEKKNENEKNTKDAKDDKTTKDAKDDKSHKKILWMTWPQQTKITSHALVSDRYVVLVGGMTAFESKTASCFAVVDVDKLVKWYNTNKDDDVTGEKYTVMPNMIRPSGSITSELTDVVCYREDPPETFHILMSGFKRTSPSSIDHCSFFLTTKLL